MEKFGKEDYDTVTFTLDNLSTHTMLETRVVVDSAEEMFSGGRIYQKSYLNKILDEEGKWADDANQERLITIVVLLVFAVVYIGIFLLLLKKVLKYRNEYKSVKEQMENDPSKKVEVGKYFRDIPREKESTPAEAGYLYYSEGNQFYMKSGISEVFSATLLQLCLKGAIAFEKPEDSKKNLDIILKNETAKVKLQADEEVIYNLLKSAALHSNLKTKVKQKETEMEVITDRVSMKDLKKYAEKDYERFGRAMNSLESVGKTRNAELGNYNRDRAKMAEHYASNKTFYIIILVMMIFFSFVLIVFGIPFLVEIAIILGYISKTEKEIPVLTEQGETERQQWKGLKKYMEEFSLLNEKDIPDLVLWEKYLVYATAFGIADKVIKQLKIVYPDFDEVIMHDNRYLYMRYMNDTAIGGGLIHNFESVYHGYRSAYNAAQSRSSSGSGGGGGFSSGGGGRWRRRPEWAVDRIKKE